MRSPIKPATSGDFPNALYFHISLRATSARSLAPDSTEATFRMERCSTSSVEIPLDTPTSGSGKLV